MSPPDLLPADEHEKGKKRAQPREHTRADYGGVKASVFWVGFRSEEGEFRGFLTYNWSGEPAGDELTLVVYHDRHSSASISPVGQCTYVLFQAVSLDSRRQGRKQPTGIDGTVLLREQ